jgi:hypothetical protein
MKNPKYKYAKQLKKIGLINFDLRKNLTPSQKTTITKLSDKYKSYLKRPKEFVIRPVQKETKKVAEKSGYLTTKKSIILPIHGATKVSVSNKKIIYYRDGKKEEVHLIGNLESFYKKAFELQTKIKKNQLVTFKYGDNAASNYSFNSLEELKKYLTEVLEPRFKNKKELYTSISIMTLERPKILGALRAKKGKNKK